MGCFDTYVSQWQIRIVLCRLRNTKLLSMLNHKNIMFYWFLLQCRIGLGQEYHQNTHQYLKTKPIVPQYTSININDDPWKSWISCSRIQTSPLFLQHVLEVVLFLFNNGTYLMENIIDLRSNKGNQYVSFFFGAWNCHGHLELCPSFLRQGQHADATTLGLAIEA